MKKTVGCICLALFATIALSVAMAVSVSAKVPKDQITLYGDDAFKTEILNDDSQLVESNAIYVSPLGSDSNNGSATSPFLTVQKALDTVQAGQTIYLRSGTYTGLNTFKSSGTEGKYITIKNYPTEKPYLTATANTDGAIFALDGNDYIKIEGLEIGDFSSQQAYGILLNADENHIIIRNNNIHNIATTKPGENDNGEANAILCYAEGKTEELSINNICIENNEVHHNTTGWCESVSVTGNAKYINIINNTVHDNTNIGIDFYGNAGYCPVKALDQPRYGVAAGNEVYGSICSYAECAGLYVDGARDIVLENNICHDNMYGIEIGSEELQADYPVKNIIARNNLVYKNSAGGIRLGGYDKSKTGYVMDSKIINNTIVNNGEGEGGWNGELCFVKCNNIDVKNNIVYKDSTEYPMIGGDLAAQYVLNVHFENNMYYNPLGEEEIYFEYTGKSAEGMTAFNAQTGGKDIFGKPDFNADYSLKQNSIGIDMGVDVASFVGSLDLANNKRIVGTIDLGAYEYQSSSVVTTSENSTETTTKSIESTTKTTEIPTETTTKSPVDTPVQGGFYKHNFTLDGKTSSYYTINGNLSTSKGSTTFNNLNLTQCLKMESKTTIEFTAAKDGILTLVMQSGNNAKIDGTAVASNNGIITIELSAGKHTITKGNTANLFYMSFLETNVKGDINVDGVVDSLDAATALKYSAGIINLETELQNIGDVNNDGKLDIYDVIKMI